MIQSIKHLPCKHSPSLSPEPTLKKKTQVWLIINTYNSRVRGLETGRFLVDLWGSLASQANLLGPRPMRDPASKNPKWTKPEKQHLRTYLGPHKHAHVCPHRDDSESADMPALSSEHRY